MRAATRKKDQTVDPLFVIFEEHLYNFQDSDQDRKTLIYNIVQDYLSFLRRKQIAIPLALEGPIVEELGRQVNAMLVKKIYGCFDLHEFQKSLLPPVKKRARKQYKKLG